MSDRITPADLIDAYGDDFRKAGREAGIAWSRACEEMKRQWDRDRPAREQAFAEMSAAIQKSFSPEFVRRQE